MTSYNTGFIESQVVKKISSPVWVFDIEFSQIVWANDAALVVWSADNIEELKNRNFEKDMSSMVKKRLSQYQEDFINKDNSFSEEWTLYPKGNPVQLHIRFSGILLNDGRTAMLCEGHLRDSVLPEVTRGADALLHTRLMISLHDYKGRTLYLNPSARSAFFSNDKNLRERFVNEEDYLQLLQIIREKNDANLVAEVGTSTGISWHDIEARRCFDPVTGKPSILVSATDVKGLKEAEFLANTMAVRDYLTKLPNRHALPDIFRVVTGSSNHKSEEIAFMFIDLDEFKTINDTMGHNEGDKVLVKVAERLSALCGSKDYVVRLGGDEFLFIASYDKTITFERRASDIIEALSYPIETDNSHSIITPSVGVAVYPRHSNDLKTLMQYADLAMYEAKSAGKNQFFVFKHEVRNRFEYRHELTSEVESAILSNQLVLHYQPRYSTKTQKIIALEALVRWQHPKHGLLYPDSFISLCEQAGHINKLGIWVLKEAIKQIEIWKKRHIDILISINVSIYQLSSSHFINALQESIEESASLKEFLEIELTETALIKSDEKILRNIKKIRSLGVKISVDDFGIGYSNLARLKKLAPDCIKIDKSLISDLPRNDRLAKIVVEICKIMGANIIAEGIETSEAASWVSDNGCDEMQGFLFHPALPQEDMTYLLS
ncbi:putative bifunctional diguanylate cyclase/phosphodiesterase [Marinomonas algicola]|uniref:putative bifunctional diguanylate cyclase/phosphodiesterase n=1 Tax=Marinomonas algicola TaxID=2773454 RepID=UPI00174958CE|nr:EAL domain-containing protein [Marinomonas algicola]